MYFRCGYVPPTAKTALLSRTPGGKDAARERLVAGECQWSVPLKEATRSALRIHGRADVLRSLW